jgi:transcriptional regulator with XRE-family HTH domain
MGEVTVNQARLQDLMFRRNMSDGKLAKAAGVSRTLVFYLRTGQTKATAERVLTAIAEALETTVDYLSEEGDVEDNGQVAVMLDEPGRKLAEVTANLSATRKEELIRIAETLLAMERERSKMPLDAGAMDLLIEIYEQVRTFKKGADPLETLEALFRRNGFPFPPKRDNGLGNERHNH